MGGKFLKDPYHSHLACYSLKIIEDLRELGSLGLQLLHTTKPRLETLRSALTNLTRGEKTFMIICDT